MRNKTIGHKFLSLCLALLLVLTNFAGISNSIVFAAPGDNPGDLVITEVATQAYNSSAYTDDGEFIEIYNNSGTDINLNGYKLIYDADYSNGYSFTITGSPTIKAGEVMVIQNRAKVFNAFKDAWAAKAGAEAVAELTAERYYINATDSYNAMKNTEGTVKLVNPSNTVVYQIAYASGDSADFKTLKYDFNSENPGVGQNKRVQQPATPGMVDPGQVAPIVPTVVSTTPDDNQTGVLIIAAPQITFNTTMDESTISSSSIYLATNANGTEGKVTANVTYNNKVVTITPETALAENTTYYIIIDISALKSSKGLSMESYIPISFTTGSVDTEAPTVIGITPTAAAGLKDKPQITFSEEMSGSTINSDSIYLSTDAEGSNKINSTVLYSDRTATIIPTAKLSYNTTYYINISNTVTDLTGNALGGYDTKVSFTTAAAGKVLSITPSSLTDIAKTQKITLLFPYDLKKDYYPYYVSNFIKVKKGTISQTATISINATNPCIVEISSSWAAETAYTIEVLPGLMDIDGNTKLDTEIFNLTIKADPKIVSSNPGNNATNVALNAIPTLTFNYEMDKATVENKSNIKLQLKEGYSSSDVSYNLRLEPDNKTLSIIPHTPFYPGKQYKIVLAYSAIKDKNGVSLSGYGEILFTATGTEDTVQPTATISPTGNSVELGTPITVTFSKPMDKNTITKDNLYMTTGTWPVIVVDAAISADEEGRVFTITPSSPLTAPVKYTIKADAYKTLSIRTATGVKLTSSITSEFTTTAGDTIAPVVESTSPANGATNAQILSLPDSTTAYVNVVFSEKIKLPELKLWQDYVLVTEDPDGAKTNISAIIILDLEGKTLRFKPASGDWKENTKYEFTIKPGIQDLSGNSLAAEYKFTATYGVLPVKLTAWTPQEMANVSVNVQPTFTFSSDMQTVGNNAVTEPTSVKLIEGLDKQISRTLSYDAATRTLTLVPSTPLQYNTNYRVVLDTNFIKDTNGFLLRGKNEISFTTEAVPVVNSAIDKTTASFDKATPEDIAVQITLNGNTLTAIKNGEGVLVKDTDYTLAGTDIITCTIKSSYISKQPVGDSILTFDFSAGQDATLTIAVTETINAATVEQVSINDVELTDGMENIALNPMIKLMFSKEINHATLGNYSDPQIYITKNADLTLDVETKERLVSPTASTTNGKTVVTIMIIMSELEENTTYYLVVKDSVKDIDGLSAVPFSLSFKTKASNALTITKAVLIKADDTEIDLMNAASGLIVPADVKRVELFFSENLAEAPTGMIKLLHKPSNFYLPVGYQLAYTGNKVTLTFSQLTGNTDHKVEIYSGIRGENNSELKSDVNYFFKTAVTEAQKPHIESIVAGTTPITKDGVATIKKDAVIKVTFDKIVDNATIKTSLGVIRLFVTKVQGSTSNANKLTTNISTAVENNKTVVTLINSPMEYGKTYYLTATGDIATASGIKMDAVEYTFQAEPAAAPRVTDSVPQSGYKGYPVVSRPLLVLVFDQDMEAATINNNNIKLGTISNGVFTPLAAGWDVRYSEKVATITPNGNLAFMTDYEIRVVHENIRSAAGIALEPMSPVTFQTAGYITPLEVVSTDPLHNAIDVKTNQRIMMTFNKAVDVASISGNVRITKEGSDLPITYIANVTGTNNNVLELLLQAGWEYGQKYNITINKNLKAVDGNAMAENFGMSFTVEQEPAASDITTELLTPVTEFQLGSDAKLSVKAANNSNVSQEVTLIVALYGENGAFLNYVAISTTIDAGKEQTLSARMKLPTTGIYTIGCFVWDSLENGNPIAPAVEIPVR